MKKGDKVRVKELANLPDPEKPYGDWIGTVVADSEPGAVVQVEFEEVEGIHEFQAADLDKIEQQ
jgi:hypothetical protein